MTVAHYATLFSAILGFLASMFLFFGTYGFQTLEGSPMYGPEVVEWNDRIKAQNEQRRIRQKIGLVLLCISFAVQAATVFLPQGAQEA